MSKKNILIRGGGTVNKGAEAMALSTAQHLKTHFTQTDIYLTHQSESIPSFKANKILEINCSLGQIEKKYLGGVRILNNNFCFNFDINRHHKTMITKKEMQSLPKLDAVIDVSGFAYGDDWDGRYVDQTLLWMKKFKKYGTHFIFLPQAWGPFLKTGHNDAYRKMLRQADLFYARDSVSQKHLARLLNIPTQNISISHDIAIGYKEGSPERGEILLDKKLKLTRRAHPVIVICPNRHLYLKSESKGNVNKYIALLNSIIELFIKANTDIILLANEINIDKGPKWDDRFICQTVFDAYKNSGRVFFTEDWLSAEDVQAILLFADFVIASRYHSAVFSLSYNIPAFCLGWSHKYQELMNLYGLEDYYLDPVKTENKTIYNQILRAFNERDMLKKIIHDRQPDILSEITKMWSQIMGVLQ